MTSDTLAPTGDARPMRTSMRTSVRKSPSKVGEVLSPDIAVAHQKTTAFHFRQYETIGKKFGNRLISLVTGHSLAEPPARERFRSSLGEGWSLHHRPVICSKCSGYRAPC